MSKKFVVESIEIDKIQTPSELIDVFTNVAILYPKQVDKLFEKYVQDIQHSGYSRETSELAAIRTLRLMADSRGRETYDLICRTITAMKHLRYK